MEKASRRKRRGAFIRGWGAIEGGSSITGSEPAAANSRAGAASGTATAGDPFFRQGLASSRGATPTEERRWRSGIFETMRREMQMQGGGLTIREMCETAGVNRASY